MLSEILIANAEAIGLNTDIPPWDLPPAVITSGKNFRIHDNKLVSSGGWAAWKDFALDLTAGRIVCLGSKQGDLYMIATNKGIYGFDGTNCTRILDLSSSAVTDPLAWSFDRMGAIPVANHPEKGAWYWYPTTLATAMIKLPFDNGTKKWDTTNKKYGNIIRSHKTFLFMLGMSEYIGTTQTPMPDSFRWSHPADANSIPASWDEADPDFVAGLASLGTRTGRIIDGLSLRDSFVLYSDEAINSLTLSGDVNIWMRTELTTTTGLLNKDCVVEANGVHFILGIDDIVINDGSSVKSIMNNRIRRHYMSNLNSGLYNHCFVLRNNNAKEIWFFIPSINSSDGCDLAYIYNWSNDSWSMRDTMPGTKHAVYGSIESQEVTWEDLEDQSVEPTWQTIGYTWGAFQLTPFDNTVVTLDAGVGIWNADPNITIDSTSTFDTYFQRTDYPIVSPSDSVTVIAVYPRLVGAAKVRITIGSQEVPGGSIRWEEPVDFDITSDTKVDVRSTGNLHCWRIESIDGGQFSFSGMQFQFHKNGKR